MPPTPQRDADPLSPTCDASKLLVPQLRGVLLQHGISLPASARKAVLVEAYEERVRPLLLRSQGVKASGRGIERLDSPASSIRTGARWEETSPSSARARASRSRQTSSPSPSPAPSALSFDMTQTLESEDDEATSDDASFTASSIASTEEETESQLDSELEEEEEEETESEGDVTAEPEAEQSFSNRNVFQRSASATSGDESYVRSRSSGAAAASPAGPSRPGMGLIIKGRASMAEASPRPSPALSRAAARHSSAYAPKQESYSPSPEPEPARQLTRRTTDEARVFDVRGLKREEAHTRTPHAHARLDKAKHVSLATLAAALCFAWLWYVHVTQAPGYCDTGSLSNARLRERQGTYPTLGSAQESEVSLIPSFAQPSCTPCPPHAKCAQGELERCTTSDFLIRRPLLAYLPLSAHYLPLSAVRASCKADTRKARLAVRAGREVNEVLRSWRGKVVCGEAAQHAATKGRSLSAPLAHAAQEKRPLTNEEVRFALPEVRLREELAPYLRTITRGIPGAAEEAYLSSVWTQALEHLLSTGAVARIPASLLSSATGASLRLLGAAADANAEGAGDDLYVARSASVGLACRARLAAKGAWRAVRVWFALACALAAAVAWGRWKLRRKGEEKRRVGELVDVALERLQDQEYAHALDPVLTPDPFVPTAQLRDHVLRSEHSPAARQRLWEKVARVVEGNANVRTRQARSRGEWLRVWEWVGVSAGTPGISRRQSMVDLNGASGSEGRGSGRKSIMGELAAQASPSLSRLGRSLLGAAGGAAADADTSTGSPLRREAEPQMEADTSRTRPAF